MPELTVKSVRPLTGVTLPYAEQGDPTGKPTILLHGFGGSWRSWRPVLAHLPPSVHAYALTLRGHGEATKPADGYRIGDFASDVAAFMIKLAIDGAVVVGHSMGSAVVQKVALAYPEFTQGLVLTGACILEPGGPRAQAFYDETVSRLEDPIDPAFIGDFLASTVAQPVRQEVRDTTARDMLKLPARVWKAIWKARLELEDATSALPQIRALTLIIWGDHDERCGRRHQETLRDEIPNSRLLVYEGTGHSPPVEEPKRFARDLAAFVARLS